MPVKKFYKKMKNEQYLIFSMDGKKYGLEVLKINGVIGMPENPPQNKLVDLMAIKIREQIVPVFHLNWILKLSEIKYNDQACIILVKVKTKDSEKLIGLVVDMAEMVYDVPNSDIEKTALDNSKIDKELITGFIKLNEDMVELLDIDKIINKKEIVSFFY